MNSRSLALSLLVTLASCGGAAEVLTPEGEAALEQLGPLGPPPSSPSNAVADDAQAVSLGQMLFFDDQYSQAGANMACVDCHQPHMGWSDDRVTSMNVMGGQMARHSQTLTNVAYNQFQFWDGRADSLWSQAYGATVNVHLVDKTALVSHLASMPDYAAIYAALFGPLPDPATATPEQLDAVVVNCGKSIEAFERTIVSRNSALDRWIEGERDALTDQQLRGAAIFVGKGGCDDCHSGPNLTDNWFHNIGLPVASDGRDAAMGLATVLASATNVAGTWSDDPAWGAEQIADLQARVDAAGDALVGAHKTPTLRDVTLRPRFGHDGEIADLRTWIERYRDAKVDEGNAGELDPAYVPRDLSDADIDDLIAFLDALTGDPSSAEVGLF